MLYDLKNPKHAESFLEKVDRMISEEAIVELKKKNQRTPKQNKYLHLLFQRFALETGYSPDYVKQRFFKKEVNPKLFIKTVNGKLGEVRELRSSADVSTEEMTKAIERFRNWSSAKVQIYLPAPDEREFLKHIEVEASRNYHN